MRIQFPLRTGRGGNDRDAHWRKRAARVKVERSAVAVYLHAQRVQRPALPCCVLLTRIAPSDGVDDDNLAGALKAVRDQVAFWIGVDDKRKDIVAYAYEQERGPWAVRIEFLPMSAAPRVNRNMLEQSADATPEEL